MARVLVVDEDPLWTRILRRVLEHGGHDVFMASDPEIALEILSRVEHDVVLVDIEMGAVELASEIRARSSSTLPILLVTSSFDPDPRADALFAAVHSKWWSSELLLATIDRVVGPARVSER